MSPSAGEQHEAAIAKVLVSLGSLRREAAELRGRLALTDPKVLIEACESLDPLESGQLRAPGPSRREQALRAWEGWQRGQRPVPTPTLMRTLCWEPEVVSTFAFRECLDAIRPLRSRTIQALLPTYLRLWRERADSQADLRSALREDLSRLSQPRGIVALWRKHLPELLGGDAAQAFARAALEQKEPVGGRLERLGLAKDTEFASAAAVAMLTRASEARGGAIAELDWLIGEVFPTDASIAQGRGWGPALSNLILNASLTRDERARERIMDLALRDLDLGDPRVNGARWRPVGEEATREVVRWRSSEDLRLFFDLVMEGKEDHQGRHRFWKEYVDGVTRSLIVLSRRDQARLHRKLRRLEMKGRRFVAMSGTNLTSAFVMEFGSVVVVEFSEPNNACYVYQHQRDKGPIPWQETDLSIHLLKNKRRAKDRLRHVTGWEGEFANSLARLGVRPAAGRR